MRVLRYTVVFDAADLASESAFWAALLGGQVEAWDDWHTVTVDGQARVAVQLSPDHVPPQWPDGPQRQQIHFDLHVDDIILADAEVQALGARPLTHPDLGTDDGFRVYADPAGHPFCLCWD